VGKSFPELSHVEVHRLFPITTMSVPNKLSPLALIEVKKVIASMKELDSTLKGQHGTQPGDPRNVTDLDALQA